jgi:hypothetical protein
MADLFITAPGSQESSDPQDETPAANFRFRWIKRFVPGLMRFSIVTLVAFLCLAVPLLPQEAQQDPSNSAAEAQGGATNPPPAATDSQKQAGQPAKTKKKSDRMFYVMPNYLTVDNEAEVQPISWKKKFAITADGTFDPYEFVTVGFVAGIRQAENAYPAFGQGMEGYAKRYGAAFADQVDGNMMVGGVFPSLLKTDPRYFRLGRESHFHRIAYAISRVFVTRKDSGGQIVNISELAGNATAVSISNFYYPAADRGVTSTLNNWGIQVGIDALGNELKEFWPDIHRRLQRRHKKDSPPDAQ